MGSSNARGRIADIVLDIARVAVANYRNLGYEYMSREDAEDFEHEVNDIIAIVREALLSESVLRVAGEVLVNRWDDDSVANEWELAEVMVESMLHAIGATKKESER